MSLMKTAINSLTILWLYIRHLLTITRLEVGDFMVTREIIAGKTRTRIQWRIRGCHRIFVSGYRDLPGNIKGVTIKELIQPQTVKIRFLGCSGVHEFSVEVPATDIHFLRQFDSRTEMQEVPAFQEIRSVVFNAQPEIPVLQSRINIPPISLDLEIHSLYPEQNQSSTKI